MPNRTFTTQDVLTAFPWISGATLHYRIKSGFLPLQNRSYKPGIPNTFTETELIQAGVLDCLATFGVLANLPRGKQRQRTSHSVSAAALLEDLALKTPLPHKTKLIDFDPWWDMSVIGPIYRKYGYNVTIQIETQYRSHPTPERLYSLNYFPSNVDGKNTAQDALSKSQAERYSEFLSIGFVFVLKIFEQAGFALGLR